jgi:glycosyltransferase involved in cell wall biosynthesis
MAYSPPVEGLIAGLDIAPPAQLAVGKGSAFVLAGHCHHPTEAIRGLEISVGGRLTTVDQHGLARIDVYEDAASRGAPSRNALHSGFVATPVVPPLTAPEELAVEAVMSFAGGRRASVRLATLGALPHLPDVSEASRATFPAEPGPRVAICMATYDPPGDLLRRQLDSIREQTHRNWICLISDESSDPAALERLQAETAGDERFVVSHSDERLGFYRNFERALSMAPPEAEFIALSDQDDLWQPTKIERLLSEIRDALLVYSDSRLTTPEGELISPSFWTNRRNNFTNYGSLLMANSVTGAASLFRRDLLDDALPLPPFHYAAFHDHWLAVVALSLGRIAYVDEPLWDYTQHDTAVIGHAQANKRPKGVRVHIRERLASGKDSRAAYYFNWQQQRLSAEVLRLRCWERMSGAKRRTLARLIGADRRVSGLAWMLGRRTRRLWGADETLERELVYGYALTGRRAVSAWTFARRRPNRFGPRDMSVPAKRGS